MDIVTFEAVTAPIIMGIVAVAAQAGFNKERWGGALALVLGIVAAAAAGMQAAIIPPVNGFSLILAGAVAGLTASGAYSGVRAALNR